jgi:hypothetical protein
MVLPEDFGEFSQFGSDGLGEGGGFAVGVQFGVEFAVDLL